MITSIQINHHAKSFFVCIVQNIHTHKKKNQNQTNHNHHHHNIRQHFPFCVRPTSKNQFNTANNKKKIEIQNLTQMQVSLVRTRFQN